MQQQPSHYQLPNKGKFKSLTIEDMMSITARLNTILVQESDLLGAMRVKEIGPLQEEKHKLSQQLESFQKMLAADRSMVQAAHPETRDQLLLLTEDLTFNIEENMRRTVVARNVNQRVMRNLMDGLAEQQRVHTYGRQGQASRNAHVMVSVNLNERA